MRCLAVILARNLLFRYIFNSIQEQSSKRNPSWVCYTDALICLTMLFWNLHIFHLSHISFLVLNCIHYMSGACWHAYKKYWFAYVCNILFMWDSLLKYLLQLTAWSVDTLSTPMEIMSALKRLGSFMRYFDPEKFYDEKLSFILLWHIAVPVHCQLSGFFLQHQLLMWGEGCHL